MSKGISLSEINKWDMEDIWKAYSMIEMEHDYNAAFEQFKEDEIK